MVLFIGRTDGESRIRRALQLAGHLIFYAVGIGIVLAGNSYFLWFNSVTDLLSPLGAINVGFYGVLGGTIVICGILLRRSDSSPARYPRAATWILCATAFLLLLNIPIMALLANEMTTNFLAGWMMSIIATGSTGGAVVGAIEARSIERAHHNQRLRTEQAATEQQTKQLNYLNSVLRHEVLNNVSIIKGYAELGLQDEAAQDEALSVIEQQSEAMTAVITDVRVLLESLQGLYSLGEQNLSQVVIEELENIQSTSKTDIEVTADIPDGIVVKADDLLPRIFRNLFSNAVKHNDSPTPHIEVTIEDQGNTVGIWIADNGPGIPDSKQAELFQPDQQADHGIGLFLVHTLVSRYDGDIELLETGADGTEFKIELNRAIKDESKTVASRSTDVDTTSADDSNAEVAAKKNFG